MIHVKKKNNQTLCGRAIKWGQATYTNPQHLISTFMMCEGLKGSGWNAWCDHCLKIAFKILDRMRNEESKNKRR